MSSASKKVLVVEDEAVLRDVYAFLLEKQGYDVYTANNGVEGLELLQLHQPAVVLLDVFMPVMGGKEVLKALGPGKLGDMKIIACSNFSDDQTRTEMLGLGAHRYIIKATMGPQDLIQVVAELAG